MKIKLKAVEIKNYKAIDYGKVKLPDDSNILGIYGANGTGKSSFIEIMNIVKNIASGLSISKADIAFSKETAVSIKIIFEISEKDLIKEIEYVVNIESQEKENIIYSDDYSEDTFEENVITHESIHQRIFSSNGAVVESRKKIILLDYNSNNVHDMINFQNQKEEALFFEKNDEIETLIIAKKYYNEGRSILFFRNKKGENKLQYNQKLEYIIECMNHFFGGSLIYGVKENAISTLNVMMPFIFKSKNARGTIGISMSGSKSISETDYSIVEQIVTQLNAISKVIFNARELKLKILDQQLSKDGESKDYIVELVSIYQGKTIPFRNESDGIKKLFGLFSALIAYCSDENVLILVDELDSGVFEFLLGELVEALYKEGKGQLIFTSHNLRVMEVLPKENLMYSTLNPMNRFSTFVNIKNTNNLRDIFLRSVYLGGQKENIYEQENMYYLQEALRGETDGE